MIPLVLQFSSEGRTGHQSGSQLFKVLANEDTLLLMIFLGLRKIAGHKMNVVFPCCANWETFVVDKKCF